MIYIHHNRDLDGFSCKVAFDIFVKGNNIVIPYDYGMDIPDILNTIENEVIVFNDVTIDNNEIINNILDRNNTILVIDHHIKSWLSYSVFHECNNFIHIHSDIHSASELFYLLLTYNEMYDFSKIRSNKLNFLDIFNSIFNINSIGDVFKINLSKYFHLTTQYDTWAFKETNNTIAVILNEAFNNFYNSDEEYDVIIEKFSSYIRTKLLTNNLDDIISEFKHIYDEKITRHVKYTLYTFEESDDKVAIVLGKGADYYTQEYIINEVPDVKIMIFINISQYDSKKFSLSFRGVDYDVMSIAKRFGGGGHILASGASIYMHEFDKLSSLLKPLQD